MDSIVTVMKKCSARACKNMHDTEFGLCPKCREYGRQASVRRRRRGVCVVCGKNAPRPYRSSCQACSDKRSKYHRNRAEAVKSHLIELYGGCCQCCGEKNPKFLVFDHINNDGKSDRAKLGVHSGTHFKFKLIKVEKRTDIRILCFNCNCGRAYNNGICPHEEGTWIQSSIASS